jgi:ubiquinone/menaquinone biosynthesis C-methylase UbiE
MSNYDAIAQFYDSVVAEPAEKAQWLKRLIREHYPAAGRVLELACGTGSLLEGLAKEYQVVGLDNSKEMLRVARKRLPDTEFILADMANFDLGQKFDAILCIYDSINHLTRFSDWQTMFTKVAEHLEPGGLFIFDMNTVEFLNKLNTSKPSVSGFSDNTMTIAAQPNKEAITTLKIEVIERHPDGSTQIHKTDIPEMSFSIPKVQASLEEHFEVLGKLGEQRMTEWTDADDKIVFVCRLK